MPIDPPADLELELVESVDDVDLRSAPKRPPSGDAIELSFEGELWYWRGPAPYHFVTVPPDAAADIRSVAADVTYGWGMIPVTAQIGRTAWTTSLFPKDGRYIVPVKTWVRKAEGLEVGDRVAVRLAVDV